MHFKKAVLLLVGLLGLGTMVSQVHATETVNSKSLHLIKKVRLNSFEKLQFTNFDLDGLEQGAPGMTDSSIC